LDETLKVVRSELTDSLKQMLSSTNLVDDLFRVRQIGRRVTH
jgi:hypothetical protein